MNAKMIDAPDRLLTRNEAAEYLRMSPKTLSNWSWKKMSPPHFSYGDGWVRYSTNELYQWLEDQRAAA